jgi:glycosyltransferase involved in cell wall biosynthesis
MSDSVGNGLRIGVVASMKKGLEHFIFRELEYFAAEGASISLFPTKFGPGLYGAKREWKLCRWHPLSVALMQPLFFIQSPAKYVRLFLEASRVGSLVDFIVAWYFASQMSDIDVIYSTFGDRKFFVGYFCKQILQKPLAVTIHAYELYQNPNPRLFARALAACDQIITVSNFNLEYLVKYYNVESSRVRIVRYSLDMDEYKPTEKFVILIVAFFVERKGHDILFKAIKKLGKDDIEVWVVGGEGAENPVDVRAMVSELDLDHQVAFFGKLGSTALKATYRACDVFCLPCRVDSSGIAEGFPNVLIEAMACGKPVITTRHVEIPRIIPEIIVDENDVDGLAQAIRQVYESASLRQRLGRQNRQIAMDTFTPRNAAQTVHILNALTKQPKANGAKHTVYRTRETGATSE